MFDLQREVCVLSTVDARNPRRGFLRSAFGLALSAYGGDPCPLGLTMPRPKEHKLLFIARQMGMSSEVL